MRDSSVVQQGISGSAVVSRNDHVAGRAPLTISFRQDEVLCSVPISNAEKGNTFRCIVEEPSPAGAGAASSAGAGSRAGRLRVLSATTMSKPTALATRVRNSGGPMCVVRYTEADRHQRALAGSSSSSSAAVSADDGTPQEVWSTPLSGTVTAIVGLAQADVAGGGLCVVGCIDGSLHVLSMASGVRLSPPMVLGTAVAFLDIRSDQTGALTILAVTAEGEMWLWNFCDGRMRCTLRVSARSAVVSMKTRATTGNDRSIDVSIERAFLGSHGMPSIFLNSLGALGGDWQAFSYDQDSQCWIRVADLRHLLSRAFNITPRLAPFAVSDTGEETSLASLQSEAARLGGFSTRDVLALTSLTGGTSVTPSSATLASGERSQTDQVKEWMALSTLSHLEDRVALSFALGSEEESRSWLGEWAAFCCRTQQHERIRWVVKRLLSGSDQPVLGSSSASRATSQDHQHNVRGLGDWLTGVPSQLVSEVVVAAVGRAGSGSSDLVAELNDAVEAHMQQ